MSTRPPPLPQPNWWYRNWKWFVPVLAVTGMALFAGFFALIFSFVFGILRSAEPYQTAMTRARADAQVRAALGEPIKDGYFITGSINDSGAQGMANMAIPISGPRGKGQVYVVAHKKLGEWRYETLAAKVSGQPPIDLRTTQESETPPSGEDDGASETQP